MSNSVEEIRTFSEHENSTDRRISWVVVAYYMVEAINMTIKSVFSISDRLWALMSLGFMVALGVLMMFSIKPVLERTHRAFIMVEMSMVVLFLISILQGHAELSLLLQHAFRALAVSVPMAFYVASIKNKQVFYNAILKGSYGLIIMLSFVFMMNRNIENYYTMSVSYAMLLPALLQINEFLENRRLVNFVFSIIAVMGITLFGARGPLLSIAVFFILRYFSSGNKFAYKVVVGILGIGVAVLVTMYFEQLGDSLIFFLSSRGIHSRTVYRLVQGNMLDSSGRDWLFGYYLELVNMKPFLGWGLLGGWINDGLGPHNMLIEFLLAFGYVGGGFLCIGAIGIVLRVFFVKEQPLWQLVTVYCAYNIVMFFVSGNFLEKVNWFIFIALSLASERTVVPPPSANCWNSDSCVEL